MAKKSYDDRTHEERLTALRIAFSECQANAYASGKVNDCSAQKVATQAGVDKTYLYSKKLTDKTIETAYRKIGEEIKKWRDDFQEKKGTNAENTALANAQIEIDRLTKERDEAQIQGAGYLNQVQHLKNQLSGMAEQQSNLIKQHTYAAHATHSGSARSSVIKADFAKAIVVSPDRHLYKNGKYMFYDKNVVDAAWRIAKDELQKALSDEGPVAIFMLVGPPCSGKSAWVKSPDIYAGGRRVIIIDACNLTQMERHKWYRIISQNKDSYKICGVFFDTPLSVLFSRNNQRTPDKQMTDDRIEDKFKSVEPIDIFDEDYFDEIKVVRHGND